MHTWNQSLPRAIFVLGVVALVTAEAPGTLIETGLYRLGNHPDGNAGQPGYGLRLDELVDLTPNHDVFTFDFEAQRSAMYMNYDGQSLHIYGQSVGGVDAGQSYATGTEGFFDIDFRYDVAGILDDGDLQVTTANFSNGGFVRRADTGASVEVRDYAGHHGYTFQFGDRDGRGHRGYDGLSGWGWLVRDEGYTASSDWLFSATLVPAGVPGPGGLAACLGLLALGGARRRRE